MSMNKGSLDKAHRYIPRRILTAQGDLIFLGAARLQRLATGLAGQVLLSGGPGADLTWGAAAIAAHAGSHENGGVDEVSVLGLSGLLADDQHVLDAEVLLVAAALVHAGRHQNGGADEISVLGLSGLLADDQHVLDAEVLLVAAPLLHEARHAKGGADPIDSALDARAIALANQGEIVYRAAAANTLAALAPGVDGKVLTTHGAGANPTWEDPPAGDARAPRTLFQHAHFQDASGFPLWPPEIYLGKSPMCILHLPANWNGIDEFFIKILGLETGDITINVKVEAGACDEDADNHTQTVNDIVVSVVNGEYECLDLMTTHATVIALLNADDDIRVTITTSAEYSSRFYGVVIEET